MTLMPSDVISPDRCCYCQRRNYTLENPRVDVLPPFSGQTLVAHLECRDRVRYWPS